MRTAGTRRLSTCRYCGRKITWVQTRAGRNMPCDPELISYKVPEDGKGEMKIVTQNGDVVSADRMLGSEADGIGYIPHFATCRQKGR